MTSRSGRFTTFDSGQMLTVYAFMPGEWLIPTNIHEWLSDPLKFLFNHCLLLINVSHLSYGNPPYLIVKIPGYQFV